MKTAQPLRLLAFSAFLLSCATPGPPLRSRVAVELLQGFSAPAPAPGAGRAGRSESIDDPGEHVIVLIDATASMQATDERSSQQNALAASTADRTGIRR